jgi:hypothetical protein
MPTLTSNVFGSVNRRREDLKAGAATHNSRLVPTHLADVRSLKTAAYFLCGWKTSYFIYILFRRN